MKKRLLFLACMTLVCGSAFAARISKQQAYEKAAAFMLQRQEAKMRQSVGTGIQPVQPELIMTEPQGGYFVFNANDGASGFVIVAGTDKLANPILGYSDDGCFSTENQPENLVEWLQGYADYVEAVENGRLTVPAAPRRTAREAIAPLLKSKWDQHAPFNMQCFNCVTGCVAVCLAQLMYYYKYPDTVLADIPAWTSQKGYVTSTVSAGTAINWSVMQDSYTYNDGSSTPANNAVADLLRLCGQSARMNWDTNNSGANHLCIPASLRQYFGYSKYVHELSRDYVTDEQWEDIIYNELAHQRPVAYSGSTPSNSGHAFLCDGYNTDGYFHMNWGWGGRSDGYFSLDNLNPSRNTGSGSDSQPYSKSHSIIIGIQPDKTGESLNIPIASTTGLSVYDTTLPITVTRSSASQNFNVSQWIMPAYSMCAVFSGQNEVNTDVALGIYKDGELVAISSETDGYAMTGLYVNTEANNAIYSCWAAMGVRLSFGAGLGDGTYHVCQLSRPAGTSEWYRVFRSNMKNLTVTISGNTATISDGEYLGLENYLDDSPTPGPGPEPEKTTCYITVKAHNVTITQGDPIPSEFTYDITTNGYTAGLTGEPYLYTSATSSSEPGDYPIYVELGSLTCDADIISFTPVHGTLTIEEAESATTYPIVINGVQMDEQNMFNFTEGVVSGTVSFDGDHTLTLDNAVINNVDDGGLYVYGVYSGESPSITVNIVGDNTINTWMGVGDGSTLSLQGDGTLTVDASATPYYTIMGFGEFKIVNTTVNAVGPTLFRDTFTVERSNVYFNGPVFTDKAPVLVDCHYTDDGIHHGIYTDGSGYNTSCLLDGNEGVAWTVTIAPGTTGIEREEWSVKREANAIYNINGQRLFVPQKGLNIVNGKKVLVK